MLECFDLYLISLFSNDAIREKEVRAVVLSLLLSTVDLVSLYLIDLILYLISLFSNVPFVPIVR